MAHELKKYLPPGRGQAQRPATMPAMERFRSDAGDVTQWLQSMDSGAPVDEIFAALYQELKRAAAVQMRRESAGHTLSATALTHEAWFRLSEQTRTQWQSRTHFIGMAAIMMRRILVNHAVAKQAAKRDALLVSLDQTDAPQLALEAGPQLGNDVVRVHEALMAFEAIDLRAAKVVELKFFGGLEIDEIAELLAISPATVKRDWTMARAWLHRELSAG